jgi:uncharacterized protein with beta-barrel porin domain
MCANGNGMLATGRVFVANSSGAINCVGNSAASGGPEFTGGTLLINAAAVSTNLPVTLGTAGGTIDTNGNSAVLAGGSAGPAA